MLNYTVRSASSMWYRSHDHVLGVRIPLRGLADPSPFRECISTEMPCTDLRHLPALSPWSWVATTHARPGTHCLTEGTGPCLTQSVT